MFAILGLVMIATSFLIAISVIAPFKEHHLSDTDCEITKCSTQNETCTKEECGSFTCSVVIYDCVKKCIEYGVNGITNADCQYESTSCDRSKYVKCFYQDNDISATLALSNDNYTDKLKSMSNHDMAVFLGGIFVCLFSIIPFGGANDYKKLLKSKYTQIIENDETA